MDDSSNHEQHIFVDLPPIAQSSQHRAQGGVAATHSDSLSYLFEGRQEKVQKAQLGPGKGRLSPDDDLHYHV